jgi:hypothetical protein
MPTSSTKNVVEVGWGVAVILRQPVNELACYVGEVQAVDEHGIRIRISATDWLIGEAVGMDWYFPWSDIAAMEIFTDSHSGWDPGITQARANKAAGLMTEEAWADYIRHRDRT